MKKLIFLSFLLALPQPTLAEKIELGPNCRVICTSPKKYKRKKVKKIKPKKCKTKFKIVKVPHFVRMPPKIVKIKVREKCKHGCPPEAPVIVGGRAAMGVGFQPPYVSGLLGLRLEVPQAYLGFEAFSALQYGVGAMVLPYVYRGDVVKVHVLDLGFLVTGEAGGFSYLSAPDVPRKVDMLLGAGLQFKIHCNVSLTADWRVAIPDPVKLADCNCYDGKRIDAGNAIGNAFASSQILLGIMVHN